MLTFLVTLTFLTLTVTAQVCGLGQPPCPETAPCCSEYGWCGSDNLHCLGGCNPLFSNTPDSCMPNAVCKDQVYTFDKSRILLDTSEFDGNPDTHDWTVDGGNIDIQDGNLVMILTETNAGTRLSSTRYVHYGTITATLKTGRWDGVVTAFITMSNVRDEIDWEFPGNKTHEAQSNMFYRATNSQGATTSGLTDTYDNWHDYTIDWSPEALVFQIDGQTVRTLKASDYNKDGVSRYPSTPSRIQLSLWPAGSPASAPGTIQWAGGMINWNESDYLAANDQFRAYVKKISVECADKPTPDQLSYVYANNSNGDNAIVEFSDKSPIIGGQPITSTTSTATSTTTSTSSTSMTTSTTSTATKTSSTSTSSTSTTTSTTVTATKTSSTSSTTTSKATTSTTSATTPSVTSTTSSTSATPPTTTSSSTISSSSSITTTSTTNPTGSLTKTTSTTRSGTPKGSQTTSSSTSTTTSTGGSGNTNTGPPSGSSGGDGDGVEPPPPDNGSSGSVTGGASGAPQSTNTPPPSGNSSTKASNSGFQQQSGSTTPSSTGSSTGVNSQPTSGSNNKDNGNPSGAASVRPGGTWTVLFILGLVAVNC